MRAHVVIRGGQGTYETTEFYGKCRIDFAFTESRVVIRQSEGSDADCGFGHNVYANGTYVRVSHQEPKFEER
jgi:hypothetical protein